MKIRVSTIEPISLTVNDSQQTVLRVTVSVPVAKVKVSAVGWQPGPQGPAGLGAEITLVSGETLSTGLAVIVEDGRVYRFNPNNLAHLGRAFGITRSAAAGAGLAITVQSLGAVQDAAYVFDLDKPCFVQADGSIGTTVPATIIRQCAGLALNLSTLFIQFQTPIKTS